MSARTRVALGLARLAEKIDARHDAHLPQPRIVAVNDAKAANAIACMVSDNWPAHLGHPPFSVRYSIATHAVRWFEENRGATS